MLKYLAEYRGQVVINDVQYPSVSAAIAKLGNYEGPIQLVISNNVQKPNLTVAEPNNTDVIYQIKVRKYMTEPSSPEFDFHDKWNHGQPMPLRIMVGRRLQETPGMVKMELWGEVAEGSMTHCMKCGRLLTNEVSKYFGIGPECGNHGYDHPFATDADFKNAVATLRIQLHETKWTGWIIKSAIEEQTQIS